MTANQLARYGRIKKYKKPRVRALKGTKRELKIKKRLKKLTPSPQKRGIIIKLAIKKPKKPNSAQRKVAKVRFSNGKVVWTYIPGPGNNLQNHAVVLLRGGRANDLPGVKYKMIRGKLDLHPHVRKRKRSKYGCKKL